MIAPRESSPARVAGFRTKLFVAMMLVVCAVTALGLYVAERNLVAGAEEDLRRAFQSELDARHHAESVRLAALAERCRALVRRPRIQEALEAYALDLLYDNAEDELRDVMEGGDETPAAEAAPVLHARFYRFLDRQGAVIVPPRKKLPAVGALDPAEEARLALPGLPAQEQIGYLARPGPGGAETVSEIIAMPIVSTVNGEVIAALVLGFKPFATAGRGAEAGIERGLWFDGRLHFTTPPAAPALHAANGLAGEVARAIATPADLGQPLRIALGGEPHLLFCKRLNPASHFPPAYEVCVYPLAGLRAQQWQLRGRVLGTGALLLLVGLLASQVLSRRLSAPVEKLAVDSERTARFSADASHQLKTPVTVLRAGLEELLAHEHRPPAECQEISALIHQTYRLSSLIEDLLLLSRMDSGALKLEFASVDLSQLIAAALDDLSALPDALDVTVETDFPPALHITGEKRYTAIILQNLLENARKYNRRGGRLRLAARADGGAALLTVGNTGRGIPPDARAHIFERFHRATIGENVPGYGLGLNLARELARLHQGDLRLVRSDETWTEFEARFRLASTAPA